MTMSSRPDRGIRAHTALVGSAACFGIATVLSKYVLATLSAVDLLLIEVAGSAVLLGAIVQWRGRLLSPQWRSYALLGAVEPAATYLLANLGLARTSAGRGVLLLSLETAFAVAAAALVARERVNVRTGLALIGGLTGAALVGAEPTGDHATLTGDVLVLASAAAAGSYGVLARRLPAHDDPLTITAIQYLAATVLVCPFVVVSWLTSGTRLLSAPPQVWAAALATAVIGSAVPFVLFNYAIAQVPAGRAALLLGLTPLFGIAAAATALHEMVTTGQLVGGLAILAGLTALAVPARCRPSRVCWLASARWPLAIFRCVSKTPRQSTHREPSPVSPQAASFVLRDDTAHLPPNSQHRQSANAAGETHVHATRAGSRLVRLIHCSGDCRIRTTATSSKRSHSQRRIVGRR